VRVLGDVIAFRTSGIVDGEDGFLELFFLGEILKFLLESLFVAAKYYEAAHAGVAVLLSSFLDFLDQTGQAVADFAREDNRDRIATILSDQASFAALTAPVAVQRVEGHHSFADLRSGFEAFLGQRAAKQQRRCQGGP